MAASSDGGSVNNSFNINGFDISSSDRLRVTMLGEKTPAASPPLALVNVNSIDSSPSSRSSSETLIVTTLVAVSPAAKVIIWEVNPSISSDVPVPPLTPKVTSVAVDVLAPFIVTPISKDASVPSFAFAFIT